jgi:8-amino-7-oxononanoate synthase
MTDPYGWIAQSLQTIHRAGWYRSPKTLTSLPGAIIELEGRRLINFASNDYLGLASDQRLMAAAIAATQAYGTGSTGSRLITGQRDLHRDLERAIANLKQTEDALVFSSGYLANLGAIAALVGKRDVIWSDQYNHSSLKKGALISGAAIFEYGHCNLVDLRQQLTQYRQDYQRCLILTDSVFSMDGDLCPLADLLDLAMEFDAMVLVDEAHATGVMGTTGAGCVEHFGCTGRAIVQMGTLSKALGSLGGYIAGSATLIDFLRNRAPTWIYTTGLSPADTAAALAAIAIVQQEPQRRQQLWDNVAQFNQQMRSGLVDLLDGQDGDTRGKVKNSEFTIHNSRLLSSASPIVCLQLSTVEGALAVGQGLMAAGFFAPAIRPPTVPTSRIRMTLMATHDRHQIARLVEVLMQLC